MRGGTITPYVYQGVSAVEYAVMLGALIFADYPDDERIRLDIDTFSRLHDLVDANEYYLEADEKFGIKYRADSFEDYSEMVGQATDFAFLVLNKRIGRPYNGK